MKKLHLVIIVILFANTVSAQTYAEWFRQKKTQIKYLEEQIAAFKAYALLAEKGYDIVSSGLNVIRDIKDGDFSLHKNHFSSLQKVNHNVKAYTKIAAIIAMQINIVKLCRHQRLQLNKSKQFSNNEIVYAGKVFDNVLDGCAGIIDQLLTLTTNGLLQMKDDERINNIDELYEDMQERYRFVQHFGSDNTILVVQRMKDQNDVSTMRELYGSNQ